MNGLLLVVDSLRARSLAGAGPDQARTPFLSQLSSSMLEFRRAYATECWTLPTHMSMFTGLLPSQHGAHFQSMAYRRTDETIAEHFRAAGYHTEVITRNAVFDGSLPGVTRGFDQVTQLLSPRRPTGLDLVLALAKPRLRRVMRQSGFFSLAQRESLTFISRIVRMGMPADRLVLTRALEVIEAHRRRGRPYFLFLNLYDVHAPYSPTEDSPLRPNRTLADVEENLRLPLVLPRICGHAYLRPGFRLSERSRRLLVRRYLDAIALMDTKLSEFFTDLKRSGALEDTLVVLTADHGEAFGEHGLYFHDASVYDVHLHVPLWVHHPRGIAGITNDVVSTAGLAMLFRALTNGGHDVLLGEEQRRAWPLALAEHYRYPFLSGVAPHFRHNVAGLVLGPLKLIVRPEGCLVTCLDTDPTEQYLREVTLREFSATAHAANLPTAAIDAAVAHATASLRPAS